MFAYEIIMISCVFLCPNFQSVIALSSCLAGFVAGHYHILFQVLLTSMYAMSAKTTWQSSGL